MQYYFAPMEGITGYIVRNAYHHYFDDIDRYYTPFIPANKKMSKRVIRDILPENNREIHLIPQLLAKNAEEVLTICDKICAYGYDTVNINLGCPSGTVVNKGRGSGFLNFPDELDRFLYRIFEKANCRISIKTRVGVNSLDGWEHLLSIYAKYPLEELIIHPRLRTDFYRGQPRMEAFSLATERIEVPLCYNGDITSVNDLKGIEAAYPTVDRIMIGRGLLAKPGLLSYARNSDFESDNYRKRLRNLHDEILEGYLSIFSGERDAMFHMKEIWMYLIQSFADSDKMLKGIKKAQTLREYQMVVNRIFCDCELNEMI